MDYAEMPRHDADLVAPVRTVNAEGRSPFAIVCDHASNRIPLRLGDLGLPATERIRHIAWDPGALGVSLRLGDLLLTLSGWLIGAVLWLIGLALFVLKTTSRTARFVMRRTTKPTPRRRRRQRQAVPATAAVSQPAIG